MAVARPLTKDDERLLEKLGEAERTHAEQGEALRACAAAAEPEEETLVAGHESILMAKYQKKGRRARQTELFPELQAEIEEAREGLGKEITFPDQEVESYKQALEEKVSPNVGEQLSKPKQRKVLDRVVRAFSCCFWLVGCAAPRVTGFEASIPLRQEAVPRVLQPLHLSPYDQLRLEYHEDLDVDEGKARWLEPGEKSGWGSPSFVVDQEGKGLLGRPVRDYRYVNSQTLDVAWPSANAERVLQRAQQAALHSTLDCIWGFTQVPIDEATQRLLSLTTRRGLLRPLVLYFGPKQ